MRNTTLIAILCLTLAGCTPKISSFGQLGSLESSVKDGQAITLTGESVSGAKNPELWYMGHLFGYQYYHYEYDVMTADGLKRVEKRYRFKESRDNTGSTAFVGERSFSLTSDRSKWIKFPGDLLIGTSSVPATRPSDVTLEDLYD